VSLCELFGIIFCALFGITRPAKFERTARVARAIRSRRRRGRIVHKEPDTRADRSRNMQIARLSLSGINEKSAVLHMHSGVCFWGFEGEWSSRDPVRVFSSHLHCLNAVLVHPLSPRLRFGVRNCAKAETAEVRTLVQSRKIAPQKSREIISKITIFAVPGPSE
jgi:hypothetical protein